MDQSVVPEARGLVEVVALLHNLVIHQELPSADEVPGELVLHESFCKIRTKMVHVPPVHNQSLRFPGL